MKVEKILLGTQGWGGEGGKLQGWQEKGRPKKVRDLMTQEECEGHDYGSHEGDKDELVREKCRIRSSLRSCLEPWPKVQSPSLPPSHTSVHPSLLTRSHLQPLDLPQSNRGSCLIPWVTSHGGCSEDLVLFSFPFQDLRSQTLRHCAESPDLNTRHLPGADPPCQGRLRT